MLYKGIDYMSPSFLPEFRTSELMTVVTRNEYMSKPNF